MAVDVDKNIRQLLFWLLEMDTDVDPCSPEGRLVIDRYRPQWSTWEEFREVHHDVDAMLSWLEGANQ